MKAWIAVHSRTNAVVCVAVRCRGRINGIFSYHSGYTVNEWLWNADFAAVEPADFRRSGSPFSRGIFVWATRGPASGSGVGGATRLLRRCRSMRCARIKTPPA